MHRFLALTVTALMVGMLGAPADATTVGYPPVDRPGPALTTPPAVLRAALVCSANVDRATRTPVLLVHGTSVTAEENWSFLYRPALKASRTPYCLVQLPYRATGDIQVNAEYVVWAIRELHRRAERKISIIGASQGGMLPRWALRFWPDLRPMVDDLIGLAPSNHGTTGFAACATKGCRPAEFQQRSTSAFIAALNSGQETFPRISYTNVYTHRDKVVVPNADDRGSSSLHGGGGRITNVALQDICPGDPSDHILLGAIDLVGFQLALDALDHDGPASPARVAAQGCAKPPPGFDPVLGALSLPSLVLGNTIGLGAADTVAAEPPLRSYAWSS
ncbi:esterase/lipase family protein [Nocardioides marmoriginsengisoli]|nr:lipase [Nocardioides marmoriginsengisoli]